MDLTLIKVEFAFKPRNELFLRIGKIVCLPDERGQLFCGNADVYCRARDVSADRDRARVSLDLLGLNRWSRRGSPAFASKSCKRTAVLSMTR